MTKILHIITSTGIGGAESMLYRLLTVRRSAAIETSVVSLRPLGRIADQLRDRGVMVHSLGMSPGIANPVAFLQLLAIIRRFSPDLVISWLYHADLMSALAKSLGAHWPLLWNLRGSSRPSSRGFNHIPNLLRVLRRFSGVPAGVIVNSQAGMEYHVRIGYHPRHWHFIPNGIDTDLFKPDVTARPRLRRELGLSESTKLIALPARYHPMKGHRIFLSAAAKLVKSRPDALFLLIGDFGDKRAELSKVIQEHGLLDHVRVLGVCTAMEKLYPALDLVTLPSLWGEGFPNVIGEAMACGIPCVATNVGDAAEIISTAGMVIPTGNSDSLKDAWVELLSRSPEELHNIGIQARNSVENRYSLHTIVGRYYDLFSMYTG